MASNLAISLHSGPICHVAWSSAASSPKAGLDVSRQQSRLKSQWLLPTGLCSAASLLFSSEVSVVRNCRFGARVSRPSRHRTARTATGIRAEQTERSPAWAAAPSSETSKPQADQLLHAISIGAEVSVFVLMGTQLVREAQRRHKMAPTATAALGRLLMGTLLIGAVKGPEETVQITFSGRGELGQMTAVVSEGRLVKGFAANPRCDPPLNPRGKMDVGGAVGPGILTVVRSHPSWQMPYTGTVPLQTGEVGEDLAHYLAESEQINCALSLGVSIGRDGVLKAAGGFIVQVLPFCSEETLVRLERNVGAMLPMSELAAVGGAQEVAVRLLSGIGMGAPAEPVIPEFGPCSVDDLKDRMLRAVESLGKRDVQQLLDEQGQVEVRCEFCSELVQFQESDLQAVLEPTTT